MTRSAHPTLVPFGNFPTADGWIVAGGSKEKFWQRLASALGRPDAIEDPRFATFEDRLANKDVLIAELDAAFATRTTAEWLAILEGAGVPCAPVNSIAQALHDPQVLAREVMFDLEHDRLGTVTHVASPIRVGEESHARRTAPTMGADTLSVMSELLGYDSAKIRRLALAGVVAGPGLVT